SSSPLLLVAASPPPNLSRIMVSWQNLDASISQIALYPSNIVNGVAPVPFDPITAGDPRLASIVAQMLATNGDFGAQTFLYPYFAEEISDDWSYLHVDGRQHLK